MEGVNCHRCLRCIYVEEALEAARLLKYKTRRPPLCMMCAKAINNQRKLRKKKRPTAAAPPADPSAPG